jgi:hypothetical protein
MIFPHPPHGQLIPTSAAVEEKTNIKLTIYTPSQIQILKTFTFHSWVLQVSTPNGSSLCCKLSAGHPGSFERECASLRKMCDAGCTTDILRVPQPRGLVHTEARHGEPGIVGTLVDYIETECYELTFHLVPATPPAPAERAVNASNYRSRGTDSDPDNPKSSPPIPAIAPSRREKWISQIQSTVTKLHALDVVWSDAKTANIILDRDDDLWVVDFGGGRTSIWVKGKLMGTREGDLHALGRILEIGGERRDWRSDEKQPTDLEVV